jgi:hypothetical protein
MKKLFIIFTLIIIALDIHATDIAPISNAIKAGNADMLAGMMAAEVDIVTPNASKKGSGSEATAILKSFFQANKPGDFTIAHHANRNESGFFVGKLTSGDKEFRVNITYTLNGGNVLITVIRIE